MNTERLGKTILVVDDDEDFLLQTELRLQHAGFDTLRAHGLASADAVLAEHAPDLVVADLMMDYMDAGFVLCHHVKAKNPKTPIILVTAVTSETGMSFDSASKEERAWIKADTILTKPVRAEQLVGEVRRLLGL